MQEQIKPVMRSYLAVWRKFASGQETPRQLLEHRSNCSKAGSRGSGRVCTNLPAARAAADRSTARWRDGRPVSPIDGMPVGIKDIIETVDMPTEWVRRCLPAGVRKRTRPACARCAMPARSFWAKP